MNRKRQNRKEAAKAPSLIAYVVVDRGENRKDRWVPCGAAWPHEDGDGFTLQLDALPPSGRLVLRRRTDDEEEGQ